MLTISSVAVEGDRRTPRDRRVRGSGVQGDPVRQDEGSTHQKKKTLPTHHFVGRRQKEMSTRFVGIAEGGARTLDLEVGNIMR
jgi:hypothetical protein